MTANLMTQNVGDGTSETGTGAWHCLDVRVQQDTDRLERLLVTTVRPWAAGALADAALESWYLDRPRTADGAARLRIGLRGADRRQRAELRALIEESLGGRPGESVVEQQLDAAAEPCAAYLAASTGTAVALLAETRSRPKRVQAAAALLLSAARATGADWAGTVRWLRDYACALSEAAEVAGARAEAEAEFFRNEAEWLRHHDWTVDRIAAPADVLGIRHRLHGETWAALVESHAAGRSADPPHQAFRRLVAAAGRQLGLSPQDEFRAAWLMSMALAAPGPREPFFADHPGAVDRQLHEQSKYFETRLIDQRPDLVHASTAGRWQSGPPEATVALPAPEPPGPSGPRFEDVLLARRSSYGRYGGPVTLTELSTLLHYSAAVTTEKEMSPELTYRVRPYPSGGTRYPLHLVLYCHDIEGLPRGTYLYDPDGHALHRLGSRDLSAELRRTAPATDPAVATPPKAGGNIDAAHCPLWIFTVGDLTYQRLHYGLRSYRLVLQESGHLGQNLSLVATWLGKSVVGLSGYYDDAVNQLLGLDGVNSAVLYLHVLGVAR
ncbi:SagB family peptide dehydrogenase [Peterkaempfera bronchialis]|nr:SagB family peptide dehydrogenase [Peterkaempfera bronchialis]